MEDVNALINKKMYAATDYVYRYGLMQIQSNKKKQVKMPEFCNDLDLIEGIHFADIQRAALLISTCYEHIKSKDIDMVAYLFSTSNCAKSVEFLEEMDDVEKVKQIRNCFAHGHYRVNKIGSGDVDCVYINNGKVRGKIDIEEMNELINIFECVLLKSFTSNKVVNIITIKDDVKVKNRASLIRKLNSVRYIPIYYGNDFRINRLRNKMSQDAPSDDKFILERELTDVDKKNIIGIFEKNGFCFVEEMEKTFPGITDEILRDIIENLLNVNTPKLYNVSLSMFLTPLVFGDPELLKEYSIKDVSSYVKDLFKLPFTFANLLLNYSFFTFDYLREMNERNSHKLFLYKDFDMTGINCQSFVGEELVKSVDPKQRIKMEVEDIRSRIRKLDAAKKAKLKRKSDYEAAGDRLLDRENKFNQLTKEISDIDESLLAEFEKLTKLSNDLDGDLETPYFDCRNLFRHLRNSVAHYRYSVDYADSIVRGDYDRMKFHFEDYDDIYDEDGNVVGEKLNFTMDCTARTLRRFLEDVNSRISNMLATSELDEMFEDDRMLVEEIISKDKTT